MKRPGPVLAWLNRAPSALYRARLGWLLGGRFLMLTAVGRTSGMTRRTALEVVRRKGGDSSAPPTLWVFATRGRHTDWYRNAVAHPSVLVDWKSRRYRATAHPLDESERADLVADYRRRHPRTAAILGSAMIGESFTGQPETLARLAHELRALRLEPAPPNVAPPR